MQRPYARQEVGWTKTLPRMRDANMSDASIPPNVPQSGQCLGLANPQFLSTITARGRRSLLPPAHPLDWRRPRGAASIVSGLRLEGAPEAIEAPGEGEVEGRGEGSAELGRRGDTADQSFEGRFDLLRFRFRGSGRKKFLGGRPQRRSKPLLHSGSLPPAAALLGSSVDPFAKAGKQFGDLGLKSCCSSRA